jgi:hypothetical protein
MASSTDKFRKSYSFLQKTLSSGINAGSTTLTPGDVTDIPTDTGVSFIIDRVDSNGNLTPTTRELITGVVSGGTITNLLRGEHGTTAQSHSAGAVIEFVNSGKAWNDLMDGLLVSHDEDGTLTTGAVDVAAVLASNVVTTAKILDANVTTAKLATASVTPDKLATGATSATVLTSETTTSTSYADLATTTDSQ